MIEPSLLPTDDEAATRLHPGMPNHVGTEAEFQAAVDKGLADLDAGRTKTAAEVAAKYRRSPGLA